MKRHELTNEYFMNIAIKEAKKAFSKNEVPVGCVIVDEKNKILARSHNLKEKNKNPLKHAEMIAIARATKKNKNWRLSNCRIYITLEPCSMCYSAIKQSFIKKIYYAVDSNNEHRFSREFVNNTIEIEKGILADDVRSMLSDFFKKIRTN